jgi:hypothetical protein
MIFNQNRNQLRQFYFDVWKKYQSKATLEPVEQVIAEIILKHPEYHTMLEHPDSTLDREYLPEAGQTNPFLHMGMHIAIHEQLTTNRPHGIVDIYHTLMQKLQDAHEVEHRIMECLGEALWRAQREESGYDESDYLECLRKLI